MNLTAKQAGLLESALLAFIVGVIVGVCCLVGITADLHQARVEFATANTEWKRESFRRADALLWKVDTALEVAGALRLDLGTTLTKLRAQVKQSSDDSTKATAVQTKAAAVTVANALDTTRQAIAAAAGESPPILKPPEEKPITVNVPAPVVLPPPKPAEAPRVEVSPVEVKRRPVWKRIFWPWGR
jgi:hypothetical protein